MGRRDSVCVCGGGGGACRGVPLRQVPPLHPSKPSPPNPFPTVSPGEWYRCQTAVTSPARWLVNDDLQALPLHPRTVCTPTGGHIGCRAADCCWMLLLLLQS